MEELSSLEDVEAKLEGAVIESLEIGINGLHLNLVDGRILCFPDAVLVALVAPKKTFQ